jgi:hypothetical protein
MSIFSNPADALKELSDVRLRLIGGSKALSACAAVAPSANSPSYLARKLQAAEAEVARRLGVFLEPTEVFPVKPPTQDDLAAIGTTPWAIEPAYDMPPDFISNSYSGFLLLNQRPVISVSSVQIINPATNTLLYNVPTPWLRLDYKHAQLSVLPAGYANSAPVSMYALQVFVLGVNVPHMIWIRYRAGLQATDPVVPDVQDVLLRLAALRVLEDQFIPQSTSQSTDGLSRSVSRDVAKYREAIEGQLVDLRNAIGGLMMGVA